MNAVAQGGDQCVDEFDMMGQHARTHGSTCAPLEGCRAAFNLKKKKTKTNQNNTNAQMLLIPPQEYSLRELMKLESLMYWLSLRSFIHLIV